MVTRDLPGSDQLYVHCGTLPSAVLHTPTVKTPCVFLPENWLFPWSRKDSHLKIELHLWTSHSFYSSIFCLQRYLLPLISESLIGSTVQIGLLFHFSHCQLISHLHIYWLNCYSSFCFPTSKSLFLSSLGIFFLSLGLYLCC